MPERIQRLRTAGWRMPPGAVYVGRPTRWGNPFVVGARMSFCCRGHDGLIWDGFEITMTADNAVEAYRQVMESRLSYLGERNPDAEAVEHVEGWRSGLAELRGHDLVCWCPLDAPCHADVLLDLANLPPRRRDTKPGRGAR